MYNLYKSYMSERKVYINEYCHSGQLRDASSELLFVDSRIVEDCLERASNLNPSLSPLPTPTLIRVALGSHHLAPATKAKWHKAENWVVKLLVLAGIMSYPHNSELRISEALDSTRVLTSVDEALGFLEYANARLRNLLEDPVQLRLGSLKLASYAFTETYVLKRAVDDGVYFFNPR